MTRSVRPLALLLTLVALAGCAKPEPAVASAPRRVLRLSQRNEPADLDPARATLPDEFFIIRALSEGLLTPNPDGGAPRPAAAERYDVSPDGLIYTFHLRAAQWSNGDPVTAADFVESYRRALAPATAAPKASVFFPVAGARNFTAGVLQDFGEVGFRAADAHTLIIRLNQPTPRFPAYVASGPWIPVHPGTVKKYGRAWTQPGHLVGNGPFTLAEWRAHQRIVVNRNPAYRDAAHVALDQIQFLRFDDGDSEERAYRAGQVDVTMDVPRTKLDSYARERAAELHRVALAETRFLTFNTQRAALADARVRQALSLAIDRQKLVERVLLGGQDPTMRFVPPALRAGGDGSPNRPGSAESNAGTQDGSERRPDFAEARRLLAAAGFAGGKNFPELELSAWSRSQTPVLEAIQQMWRQELGLNVVLAVREAKVHVSALMTGDYDIGFMTAIPDVADPIDLLSRFAARAPENYPHWAGPEFNQALAAGDAGLAEQRLLTAAVIAPLYFNTHPWLQSPRVHGWREDAFWTRFYPGVSIDP
jgi:oligopeptide transport system substrate-binding protein